LAAADVQDLEDLSSYLGVSPQHLFALVNKSDDLYTAIELPKRNGGTRQIYIPRIDLKGVQKLILRTVLEPHKISESAYAYSKGKSVVMAGSKLCGKKAILRIDIRNFFPSITSARVYGLYISLGYLPKTSWLLTKLTTYKGRLCQGSPTSPYISNLICRNLDNQLNILAGKWGCSYIRYSDDIFIFKSSNFNGPDLTDYCIDVLSHNGFDINPNKTRYRGCASKKVLLGLNVSGPHPTLTKTSRRKFRAAFHRAASNFQWANENQEILSGMLHWYKNVYGKTQDYIRYKSIIDSAKKVKKHNVYYSA